MSIDITQSHQQPHIYHPGKTPTWVLIHGAGCDRHFWTRAIKHLQASGASIFAASMPGRTDNEAERPLKTVEAMAEWWDELLGQHGIEAPIVVGHSMGGAVAMELACRAASGLGRPLSGLVLLATGARLRVHPNVFRLLRTQQETTGAKQFLPWHPSTSTSIIQEYEALSTPPINTTFADWKAANQFDRMDTLHSLSLPTLVIGGNEDVLTPPKYASFLAQQIPTTELQIIENAGHMFPIERTEELVQSMIQWKQMALSGPA